MKVSKNTSAVRAPKWQPDDSLGYPIIVSRGEPRRTDEQMYDEVLAQVKGYRAAIGKPVGDETAQRATAAIAFDYIYKEGAQHVVLSRELVRSYLKLAMSRR